MCKLITFFILFGFSTIATCFAKNYVPSKDIQRLSTLTKQNNNGIDLCSTCVSMFDVFIYAIIDGITELGIAITCNDLCDYITQKSTDPYLPAFCSIGCDAVGINEFIKLATDVDLDPIYFCESLKFCPIKDNGDAKFIYFEITPTHAESYTKFSLNMGYQTINGTGTSQLLINLETLDDVKIAPFFLIEAKSPGNYTESIAIDTTPDPDCESTTNPCEVWYPGVYNVTVMICNGECNSHHPHSRLYDTAKSSFIIDR